MHHEENKLDMLLSFHEAENFLLFFSSSLLNISLNHSPPSSTITYNSRQASERVKISFPSLQILLIYISLVITPSN
jgi:hypothetical protein